MIEGWAVTIIFVAVAIHAAIRAGRIDGVRRVSQVLHLIMAAAMIAMTWVSQPEWLGWLQLAGFLLIAAWYLLPGTRCRSDHHSVAAHAIMNLGMAWMVLVMIIRPPGTMASLAGVAVLVALLVAGGHQVVALAMTVRPARPAPRQIDRAATVLMLAGMIIMTAPMLTISTA